MRGTEPCAPSDNITIVLTLLYSVHCTDLEEELRVVGQSLQQLEVSEEKALQREDDYQRSDHTQHLHI